MIDIIIPAYNAKKTIFDTLSSISIQYGIEKYKTTIVNDCSDDNYDDIISIFRDKMDINLINLEHNVGAGLARQVGIDNTKNPYITFIDSDDIFIDAFALYKLEMIMLNKNVFMGVSNKLYECEDKNIQAMIHNASLLHGNIYNRAFLEKNNIRFNSMRVNEDVYFNTILRGTAKGMDCMWFIDDFLYFKKYFNSSVCNGDKYFNFADGIETYTEAKIQSFNKEGIGRTFSESHSLACLNFMFNEYMESPPQYLNVNLKNAKRIFEIALIYHSVDNILNQNYFEGFVDSFDLNNDFELFKEYILKIIKLEKGE